MGLQFPFMPDGAKSPGGGGRPARARRAAEPEPERGVCTWPERSPHDARRKSAATDRAGGLRAAAGGNRTAAGRRESHDGGRGRARKLAALPQPPACQRIAERYRVMRAGGAEIVPPEIVPTIAVTALTGVESADSLPCARHFSRP
jgi:hypothetical protein